MNDLIKVLKIKKVETLGKRIFLLVAVSVLWLLIGVPAWAASENDFWYACSQGNYGNAGMIAGELSANNPAYLAFGAICYQNASDYEQFRIYDHKFRKSNGFDSLKTFFDGEPTTAPDDPQRLLFQGLTAMLYPEAQLGDPGPFLQKAAAKLGDNPYLNNYLALSEMNKHNDSLFIQKYLQKAIASKKDYPEPYLNLAEVLAQNKETDKAVGVLLDCFINCPKVPAKAYLNLIDLTSTAVVNTIKPYGRQMTVSVPAMKEIYRLKVKTSLSKNPAHLNTLAETLAVKGNTSLAHYFLTDTISADKGVQTYAQMQIANYEGDFEQAIRLSEALLNQSGLDYQRFYETGNVLFYGKEFSSAITFYEEALKKMNPDDDEFLIKIYTNLGICLYLSQEYQSALGYFEKILVMNPHDVNSLIYSGLSFRDLGDGDKALESLTKGLEYIPDADWRQEITDIINQLKPKDEMTQE